MKKLLLILFCLPMIGFGQQTYVPDAQFEGYLEANGMGNGVPNDDYVTTASIDTVTNLDLSNNWLGLNIADLTGIEDFTALTNLHCGGNQITSLDVSNNLALTFLVCGNNQITSLDVSGATALTNLYCQSNQLTSLDVSQNTALTTLFCFDNQLTSLDVSQNTALTALLCYNNQLTSLDVSANTALTTLLCYNNQLTSLDVSANIALTTLFCYNNQLTSLDVNGATALTNLECNNNQLTSLDVNGATALIDLKCNDNQIDSLDLNSIPIEIIECVNNNITYLNINNTALSSSNFGLFLVGNPYTTIIISNNQILSSLSYSFNNLTIENLQISNNPSLNSISIENTQIINLNINNNTLFYLTLENMQVDTINVNNNTTLLDFYCYPNQISVLNVNNNPALTNLYCYNNQLTSLDVSNNTALTNLECNNNQLTSLDVSNNLALNELYCGDNYLTNLDVSNNLALTDLECNDNLISCLDVSVNLALTNLNCSNNLIDQFNTKNGNWINNLYVNAMSNNLLCAEVDNIGYATNNWLFDSFTSLNANCNYSNPCNMIYGCTDLLACNYNSLANIDDSSCVYPSGIQQSFSICNGDSVLVGNNIYSTAGIYTDTLATTNGCDSIVYTSVSVIPTTVWQQSFSICNGDSVIVGNSVYNTAGNYTDTLATTNGCDSIVYTNITMDYNTSSFDTLSVTASIVWNGMPLNASGDYSVTLNNLAGCDSIVNLNLTITTTGISDIVNTKSNLVKITDMLGQKTPYRRNTPLFYIYDNGTVEKRIVIE
jgi:Leucine-rich repeat (LRR) protein